MRTSTKNTINENGKITKVVVCYYNDKDELVKIEYKNPNLKLLYYEIYEYDNSGNRISEFQYSDKDELQGSIEYGYNESGDNLKRIERTSEGEIWDWIEDIEIPDQNTILYLAKDEKGNVIHKTEENTIDKSQKRYNHKNELYAIRKRKLDHLNRIIQDELINQNGVIEEKILYEFKDCIEIKTFYSKGKFGYKNETVYDENGKVKMFSKLDEKNKIENWYCYEYDNQGRETKHMWKTDFGKHTGFVIYEYEQTDI